MLIIKRPSSWGTGGTVSPLAEQLAKVALCETANQSVTQLLVVFALAQQAPVNASASSRCPISAVPIYAFHQISTPFFFLASSNFSNYLMAATNLSSSWESDFVVTTRQTPSFFFIFLFGAHFVAGAQVLNPTRGFFFFPAIFNTFCCVNRKSWSKLKY